MSNKTWNLGVECPYCKTKNKMVLDRPRTYEPIAHRLTCINAETQTGCKRQFEVLFRWHVSIHMTKENAEIEKNRLVKPATMQDLKNVTKGKA